MTEFESQREIQNPKLGLGNQQIICWSRSCQFAYDFFKVVIIVSVVERIEMRLFFQIVVRLKIVTQKMLSYVPGHERALFVLQDILSFVQVQNSRVGTLYVKVWNYLQ